MSAGHGRAILFVDDDLGLAKIAHRRLTRQSHRVTTVHSGEEAVRWLDCHDVDLVVLDHSLPDTSAEELVDRLKLNERVFDFIAISGQGDEQVAVSLMKRGALDYVVKDGQFWSRFDAAVETALKYLDAERELARTKKTLDAAEQRLEQVASSICEVFWLADTASGRFEYVSPAFETIWGRPPAALVANAQLWTDTTDPSHAEVARALAAGLHRDATTALETLIQRPDGERRWIRHRTFSVRGQRNGVAGIAEDITEQRELTERLRQAGKMEAIGHLAGGVAHDFNNLLTVIVGSAALAREAEDDSTRDEDIARIITAAESATALTRQLLAFGRKQVLHPEVVDLSEIVEETISMLDRTFSPEVDIRVAAEDDLPPVRVDKSQLQQVILNLAVNARDAMQGVGALSFVTGLRASDGDDCRSQVCLTVSDTGAGMDAETLAKACEPFFTTKEAGHSSGLGLATVHGIVCQSGGEIEIESQLGKGTVVRVIFPAVRGPVDVPQDRSLEAAPKLPPRTTVLVVDDNDLVRATTVRMLQRANFVVLEVSGGAEGLRLLRVHGTEVELAVVDMLMPRMSGIEFGRTANDSHPQLRILYISGHALDSQGAAQPPRANFLPKPFKRAQLLDGLSRLLAPQFTG